MNISLPPRPRQRQYSMRYQARLDGETYATLETLTKTFHRKRGPILLYVMQWGLSRSASWSIDQSIPTKVHPVPLLLEPELLQQVQDAAAVHGATVAAWIRHAIRQISGADFPPSWHPEAAQDDRPRSHDSRQYGTRFVLRLDASTHGRLGDLSHHFTGRTPKSSASSSPRRSQRIFPRAGSSQWDHTTRRMHAQLIAAPPEWTPEESYGRAA